MSARLSIDTGGTFTDLVWLANDSGELHTSKAPAFTIADHGDLAALLAQPSFANTVIDVIHGTTVAINAVLERRVSPVAFLATAGFRDILETRRLWREHLFGHWWERPAALVRRRYRFDVPERIGPAGDIVRPLNEAALREIVRKLTGQNVHAYSVCFLHAPVNPAHERRAKEIIEAQDPQAHVVLSSQVLPELREYERASTTTIAAMLRPVMSTYLDRFREQLADALVGTPPLRIMNSTGGLMAPEAAITNPVSTIMSGPASGVTAALHLGETLQLSNLITLDMGGTSTDVSLIVDGKPLHIQERNIFWDIPIRGPSIDVQSIGAGGGSLVWLDSVGVLKVGPKSAGATPGPACYGRGGEDPTVTDACLTLGLLAPDRFLGGQMLLDAEAARQALRHVASGFSSVEEAAEAIYHITLHNMALLVREMTINRGYDPRDFSLISFGGAGGLFAAPLANELQIPQVIIPEHAAVFSALGGLLGDVKYDYQTPCFRPATPDHLPRLRKAIGILHEQAEAQRQVDQLATSAVRRHLELDLRYEGESFELTVPVAETANVTALDLQRAVQAFHQQHEHLYGFQHLHEPVEMVNVRLRLVGRRPRPHFPRALPVPDTNAVEHGEKRAVWHEEQWREISVYRRAGLSAGSTVCGHALIEEAATAAVVPAGWRVRVDRYGNLRMSKNRKG